MKIKIIREYINIIIIKIILYIVNELYYRKKTKY